MKRARDTKGGLPEPPGHDPTNPAHVRSATIAGKIRATNENKTRRRRHEEAMTKHTRFASRHQSGQLFDAFNLTPPAEPEHVPPYSADFMLAQRRRARENMVGFMRELRETDAAHTRARLVKILEIVGWEEFQRIMRDVFSKEHPAIHNRIHVALLQVERRRDTVFTEHMDIVLAVMEAREGEPPTACELHRSAGDGMTRKEVWEALISLERIDLLKPNPMRRCAVCDLPSEATFRASNRKE